MSKDILKEDRLFESIKSEQEDLEIDSAPYKINTYGADFTLEVLYNKIKNGEIIVPSFQRRFVWTLTQSSQLIESFLLGLPVPQIFLYKEEEKQDLLVVDGQQRLKSIQYFFDEHFEEGGSFYLRNVKSSWEGKTYSQLSEPDSRRLKNSILRATIFQQSDPKDNSSIFEIFRRLNTGGVPLTQQEIRNCVIHGNINPFLESINSYEPWRLLFGKSKPDSRMRDVEMIIRFFALYENIENYKKPMKEFISEFMMVNKNMGKRAQDNYCKIFRMVTDLIFNEIGIKAFKLKAGINVAVFDSLMVALARLGGRRLNGIKNKYNELIRNEAYLESISKSTTDKERVESRYKIAKEIFSSK